VIYFRAGSGLVNDGVQYGRRSGVGAAWQIYHYDGANAAAAFRVPNGFTSS
jgi:hypothetical protein